MKVVQVRGRKCSFGNKLHIASTVHFLTDASIFFFFFNLILLVINFVSGCGAGGMATLVSFPFDILRTRMIGQGEPKVRNGLGH